MKPVVAFVLLVVTLVASSAACGGRAVSASAALQTGYDRRPLLPADEADQAPDFKEFRQSLLEAIRARDAATVLDATTPEIRARLSRLALPRERFVGGALDADWEHLEELIVLGGTFTTTRGAVAGRREFCAPYTYSAYPRPVDRDLAGELDPWIIISPKAALRSAPDPSAQVLTWLSYELVKPNGDARDDNWYGVVAHDGREGWVASSDIRDPDDYHVCFALINGRWLMTAFDRGLPPRY
jgi:hypothetical protein